MVDRNLWISKNVRWSGSEMISSKGSTGHTHSLGETEPVFSLVAEDLVKRREAPLQFAWLSAPLSRQPTVQNAADTVLKGSISRNRFPQSKT
jgi:hypothetical protein